MIPIPLIPIATHLWQSTLFAGGAALLTLVFRRNQARVRCGIWLAASYKFLLPFPWLISLGGMIYKRSTPAILPRAIVIATNAVNSPIFIASPSSADVATRHLLTLTSLIMCIWVCGSMAVLAMWLVEWYRLNILIHAAEPVRLQISIPVLSVASRIETGVFGIFRPKLLLPAGIMRQLKPSQLQAVVAHELCHVRRRDNLTAGLHMLVEAIFWFHPLVWWLNGRIVQERELACDEEVIRAGSEPTEYVETILAICKLYLEAPLACVSGISGSDLKKRVRHIMIGHRGRELTLGGRLILSVVGIAAIMGPFAFGMLNAPATHAQGPTASWEVNAGGSLKFDVESVKQDISDIAPSTVHSNIDLGNGTAFTPTGGLFSATNIPLFQYISFAFKLSPNQVQSIVSQLPKWANTERFDVEARAAGNPSKDQYRLMVQALLAERFKLSVHFESKATLVLAMSLDKAGKLGPQLQPHRDTEEPCDSTGSTAAASVVTGGFPKSCGSLVPLTPTSSGRLRYGGRDIPISMLAMVFSNRVYSGTDMPLVDETGLTGTYDLTIELTPEMPPPTFQADPEGPTLVEALKNQLGIKLVQTTSTIQLPVIDKIEEPSKN